MPVTPSVRRAVCPAIVAVLAVAFAAVRSASAQTPPVECVTYPSDSPWQTIEVHLVGDDCQLNPYAGSGGIPRLRTLLGQTAHWDVCNKCGAPVDVRLSKSMPNDLGDLFVGFWPMIDASGASTATNIATGQHSAFSGLATGDDDYAGWNKYSIAVKLSSEGIGGWAEFDPELQIDTTGLPPPFLPGISPLLVLLLIGVAAAVLGFGAGRWSARRRVTP